MLYYNYFNHFDRIESALSRLRKDGSRTAGEIYGRITMLSALAGHFRTDELFWLLDTTDETTSFEDGGRMGITQVLCANLKSEKSRADCEAGLLRLLRKSKVSKDLLRQIDRVLEDEDIPPLGVYDVAEAFLNAALSEEKGSLRFRGIFRWLERLAKFDPLAPLALLKLLVDKMDEGERRLRFVASEVTSVLTSALREADERDDRDLIHSVISLQDRLLRFGFTEIDEMLDAAGRP